MQTGYWMDLESIQFAEGETTWVQALPLGAYSHPLYGKVVVTPERVSRFASNIKNNVREIDLDINYDHREHTGKAAGWIRDAEDRGTDGLWLNVEFTEPALDAVKRKEYRYLSSEFSDEWEHPKTGTKYQDVVFGAALTNRPWLKDILPINMSEVTGGEQVEEFLQRLRSQLKLSEEATEDEILEALSKQPEKEEEKEEKEPAVATLSEEDRKLLKTLGEQNPTLQKLVSVVDEQSNTIKELSDKVAQGEAATKLAEIKTTVQSWTQGDKYAIPPAALEGLPTQLAEFNSAQMKVFGDFVGTILQTGLVELKERGIPRVNPEGKSYAQQFSESADKLMSENPKLSYADAVSQISAEDPDLWDNYRLETLEGQEVQD